MERPVRVRFAPSPTGSLHIGGVRTALYNYLLARKTGGTFIIRIEDTDQTRFVPGAEDYIMEALRWCGITPDEGVVEGGPHAPYRQSERKAMYKQYAMQLIENDNAYYAFDTPEELEAMRERLKAAQVPDPKYNSISRMSMKNSLTLPEDEVKAKLAAGEPYVIRLKVPRKEEVRLNDLIRGWVMVHSSTLDDKVLMKSDGMPTYHLANVVDDYLMQITHVIRGEEWLPSAPTHVLLYKAFGWEAAMPQFAHLPLLLKPDGNGKLSKRDGEAHGFPVFPLAWQQTDEETGLTKTVAGFREEGYLPEAVVNFLALLGWNPGTQQELFTFDELVQTFTVERIGKSGTKFDINKAKWFNQQYLRQKPDSELAQHLLADLAKNNITCSQAVAEQVVGLVKERAVFYKDLWTEAEFMFVRPTAYDETVAAAKWNDEAVKVLTDYQTAIMAESNFTPENAKAILNGILEKHGIKIGKVMQAVRLAVTGRGAGPDLMQIMSILGNAETQTRINHAIATLSKFVAV
jgi:glutamyl-tRNA synthetase